MIIVILGWSLDDDVFDRFRGGSNLKAKEDYYNYTSVEGYEYSHF